MQIERDTLGKLQCHPYPHEYVDSSKQCAHCAFFMGLQRKPGEVIQEGQQFDIRGTVDEFRLQISMYSFWKPGMEIYVYHVRRKQIPSYVLPEGYKRSRPPRFTGQQLMDKSVQENGEIQRPGSTEKRLKRKKEFEGVDANEGSPEKRQSISPQRRDSISPDLFSQINSIELKECSSASNERLEEGAGANGICQSTAGTMPEMFSENCAKKGIALDLSEVQHVERQKDVSVEFTNLLFNENAKPGCISVVSHLNGQISSKDIGCLSLTGSKDRNCASVGVIGVKESSDSHTYESDATLLVGNGKENDAHIYEDGLQELEVLDLYFLCIFC